MKCAAASIGGTAGTGGSNTKRGKKSPTVRASTASARRFHGRLGWDSNPNLIWNGPGCFSAGQIQAVHRDFQLLMVYFDKQVVIIHLFALERIACCPLDGIGVGAAAAADEIGDAAMLMPLVIMYVSREEHDSIAGLRLALFHGLGQCLLGATCRVAAAEFLVVRGTGVRRM